MERPTPVRDGPLGGSPGPRSSRLSSTSPATGQPPVEPRLSTGSPELDAILGGGLMPHRPYL
ncbi:MAG TPA: hypothetical protein VMH90_06050, partial [Thermoplasmata archaeon]|nr:hypothetical protein [Thermoplasmata archaeon]